MPEPGTWLQLNFKTPAGTLVNIYATSSMELDEGLDAIEARLGRVADIERMAGATATVNQAFSVPQQRQAQPAQEQASGAPAGPVPTCIHGPKKWMEGVSKNTGKPYAFWACQGPRGDQCR